MFSEREFVIDKAVNRRPGKLGFISAMRAYRHEGRLYVHFSFGRVVDSLAARYEKVLLCVPVKEAVPDSSRDYIVRSDNVEVVAQPFFTSSLEALRHPAGILCAYARTCCEADVLFVRGIAPFVAFLYASAWFHKCGVCHWVVGNAVALLKSHRRSGLIIDFLSTIYAWQDRIFTKIGRWLVGGSFVCNGNELAGIYKSARTVATVSSAIKTEEFYRRLDTCQGDKIRILFIGFIRPEKGVEYLIEAVGKLRSKHDWELILVGPSDYFPNYREKLDEIVAEEGIGDRIEWAGFVPYGVEMFKYLRTADIFVLPTLSEGTPRVLVEARANSLPVVSTTVGGIPTSVTDGYDGLLVPPKDSDSLARAIDTIIADGELRRSLIHNGLKSVREMTLEKFTDVVMSMLESAGRIKG